MSNATEINEATLAAFAEDAWVKRADMHFHIRSREADIVHRISLEEAAHKILESRGQLASEESVRRLVDAHIMTVDA